MGQRFTWRGKHHCEAFPALDILQAERSLRAGIGICEWRNKRGMLVGHVHSGPEAFLQSLTTSVWRRQRERRSAADRTIG